jgi:DNA-binding beta-propeller fold protein YncE
MRINAVLITIFIIFITVIFCCPSIVLAGNTFNKKKPGVHQLHSPIRLAMTSEGNLLVSDYQLGMIVTVDCKNLESTSGFPVQGKPLGVAYARGSIYVGNASKQCVEVYARDGEKLYQFSEVIKQPTDITIDEKQGLAFVVDAHQKKVNVFNLKGKFIRAFPGLDPDNLLNPTGITLDPAAEEVLVSDYGDITKYIYPRIQIFDYDGNLLYTIPGKNGMFGVRFSRPQGLAVDESGHVFMVDCYSGEIMVFDRYNGNTLKVMAGYGTEPGQLRLPLDIVIDPSSKDIFVTNNRSATIEIFEKGGVL